MLSARRALVPHRSVCGLGSAQRLGKRRVRRRAGCLALATSALLVQLLVRAAHGWVALGGAGSERATAGARLQRRALEHLGSVAWDAQAVAAVATVDAAAPDAGGNGLPALVWGAAAILAIAAAAFAAGEGTGDGVVDKKEVKDYFNTVGFSRWNRIYGESGDINFVQQDIRDGHAETVRKILTWLDGPQVKGKTVCDAGCGTGNLSIPLALRGAQVTASDISNAMVSEAERRAREQLSEGSQLPDFQTSDLEALDGRYDCVCCVDVLIHYPPERLQQMVTHLAGLSKDRVILSFAPRTWYYKLLKAIGDNFPGPSKATRAYLHDEALVEDALKKAGFEVTRRDLTATNFYFSSLMEARLPAVAAA